MRLGHTSDLRAGHVQVECYRFNTLATGDGKATAAVGSTDASPVSADWRVTIGEPALDIAVARLTAGLPDRQARPADLGSRTQRREEAGEGSCRSGKGVLLNSRSPRVVHRRWKSLCWVSALSSQCPRPGLCGCKCGWSTRQPLSRHFHWDKTAMVSSWHPEREH